MKSYPSITVKTREDVNAWVFPKYDGSNIRAEWNKKRGFYKFGSRTRLIGDDEKPLGQSIELIKKHYESLSDVFSKKGYESVVCFFEFFGQHSQFGNHNAEEPHEVILFDIAPYKKGILEPDEFIDLAGPYVKIPPTLYYGKINTTLIQEVKVGTLEGMTFEGVVCKSKNDKKTKMPIMFKIKSEAWYKALKEYCHGDENLFKELS